MSRRYHSLKKKKKLSIDGFISFCSLLAGIDVGRHNPTAAAVVLAQNVSKWIGCGGGKHATL